MIMKASSVVLNQLTIQSPWFRDALMDLPPSAARVILRLKPADGTDLQRKKTARFSLYAEGDFGTVQVGSFATAS